MRKFIWSLFVVFFLFQSPTFAQIKTFSTKAYGYSAVMGDEKTRLCIFTKMMSETSRFKFDRDENVEMFSVQYSLQIISKEDIEHDFIGEIMDVIIDGKARQVSVGVAKQSILDEVTLTISCNSILLIIDDLKDAEEITLVVKRKDREPEQIVLTKEQVSEWKQVIKSEEPQAF